MDLNPYEAIVVGSGSTGGMAALTLAEQGIKVLVIEAGPQIKRDQASTNEPLDTFKRINNFGFSIYNSSELKYLCKIVHMFSF